MVSPATCLIGGIQYLIHPQTLVGPSPPQTQPSQPSQPSLTPPKGSITATIKPDALIPVTLLTTDDIFGGRLEQILDHYDAIDDVFIPEFGSVLIEKSSENGTLFNVETEVDSRKVYALDNDLAATTDPLDELPSGPYILQGPNLHQAWRLYDDENEAFNFGVIPQDVTRVERYVELWHAMSTRVDKDRHVDSTRWVLYQHRDSSSPFLFPHASTPRTRPRLGPCQASGSPSLMWCRSRACKPPCPVEPGRLYTRRSLGRRPVLPATSWTWGA